MKKWSALIIFLIVSMLILVVIINFTNKNQQDNSNFGESCFDRTTDDYLRGVCEKIKDSKERDNCYYEKAVLEGYDRICHLIENEILKQKCVKEVNKILSDNETLKQRAEQFNPCKI